VSVLGLLPAIRGGLGELARTGQHTRLVDGYLRRYAGAFDAVRYFSYLPESLDDFTRDREILARVSLVAGSGWHPWLYTFLMPLRHRRALAGCSVLRVFQITGAVPAIAARRRFGVPFVTTYGFWYAALARSRLTRVLRRAVASAALATAAAIIVTTPALEAYVRSRRPRGAVHLIPNGVDTTRFRPVPRPPREGAEVLYVGRLSDEKNLGTILDAAASLDRGVRVTFLGDGPARGPLEARAGALGVTLRVRPFVPHAEVAAIMAGADVFVLASFSEGHPKVLLEAMASGVPCVASNCEGNRSLVEEGRTGLLFDPHRPDELAGQIRRVLAEARLAAALASTARSLIVDRYDLNALLDREIALLQSVAGERTRPDSARQRVADS
jgi:glycosyltransferase involved in cell wall biosynthesis